MSQKPTHLFVDCEPRYWEDTEVNGVPDEDGSRIPFRVGDAWRPVIELATGTILNWPEGMTARIHYKVCDAGDYWLGLADGKRLLHYGDLSQSSYVPDAFLCHGGRGFGDYIILNVGADGQISGYKTPQIDDEWVPCQ